MWDLPGPGLEPVSPALAGGFSTTAPPGKSHEGHFIKYLTSTPQKCQDAEREGKTKELSQIGGAKGT